MLRFTNCTTKETFKASIRWSDIKVEKLESPNKNQKLWKISDRFSNVWEVLFTGNVNEFRVSYHDKSSVDLLLCGDTIEIHRAIKNGRRLKSDKYLKQFINLALMVGSRKKFGYLR